MKCIYHLMSYRCGIWWLSVFGNNMFQIKMRRNAFCCLQLELLSTLNVWLQKMNRCFVLWEIICFAKGLILLFLSFSFPSNFLSLFFFSALFLLSSNPISTSVQEVKESRSLMQLCCQLLLSSVKHCSIFLCVEVPCLKQTMQNYVELYRTIHFY